MSHIFYNTKELTLEEKNSICDLANEKATEVKIHKLVCSESIARQEANLSYDEIMEFLDMKSHFVAIHRKTPFGEEFGEIGFSSNIKTDLSYFLFIYLNLTDFQAIIKTYNLKKLV